MQDEGKCIDFLLSTPVISTMVYLFPNSSTDWDGKGYESKKKKEKKTTHQIFSQMQTVITFWDNNGEADMMENRLLNL